MSVTQIERKKNMCVIKLLMSTSAAGNDRRAHQLSALRVKSKT